MRFLLLTVATIAMIAMVACGASPANKSQSFMESVRGYNEGIRWQRWTHAAAHISPRERDDFLDERDELEDDLRITDYQIRHVTLGPKSQRARVLVKYEWHSDRKGIVNHTTSRQMWERHGRRWILAEEYRIRGEEMPGLAEEPEDPDELEESDESGQSKSSEDPDKPGPTRKKRRSAGR